MGLKLKVEKLDDVDESARGLYKEVEGGGGFQLDVDDLEDTGALKRAKDHEVEARKKAEAELKRLQDERKAAEAARKKAEEDANKASGNVEALEKSWQAKLTAREQELIQERDSQVSSLTADVTRLTADTDALKIATELAVDPDSVDALLPHVRRRLAVDVRDGRRVSVVVDADGKPTAMSLADLAKELKASKSLARLIKGSQGSGGGAGGSGRGGGAPPASKKRSEMTNAERAAYISEHGKNAYLALPG